MRFRLVPRDQGFFPLFDDAADNVVDCAGKLRELVGNLSDAETLLAEVVRCERRGDEITHAIEQRLNQSFVTPFDREDMLALTETLDDVVDDILGACDLLVLHRVDAVPPEMAQIADLLVEAATTERDLIAKMSRMRGLEPELETIDRLESEADKVYRQAVARLFSGEYKAFDVLKWKDVFEALEESINRIEKVSDIIQSVALKHA